MKRMKPNENHFIYYNERMKGKRKVKQRKIRFSPSQMWKSVGELIGKSFLDGNRIATIQCKLTDEDVRKFTRKIVDYPEWHDGTTAHEVIAHIQYVYQQLENEQKNLSLLEEKYRAQADFLSRTMKDEETLQNVIIKMEERYTNSQVNMLLNDMGLDLHTITMKAQWSPERVQVPVTALKAAIQRIHDLEEEKKGWNKWFYEEK